VALGEGFLEIRGCAARQGRVALLGSRLHLGETAVHRVQQRRRHEHRLEAPADALGIEVRARGEPQQVEQVQALLHGHQAEAVEGNSRIRAPAPSGPPQVSGERGQQDLGTLHQIPVVVLARAELGEDQGRLRYTGDLGGLLGTQTRQPLAQDREHGAHRHGLARDQLHPGARLEPGPDALG
jgi:hypothetical protein